MWLLQGQPSQDHSTIARLRKDYLGDAVEDLFYQMVKYLHSLDEVKFENLFVEGTKIETRANRYTFVWKKVVNKNEARMCEKIKSWIDELNLAYMTNFTISKECTVKDLGEVLAYLEKKRKEFNMEFMHGIGKRKSQLQRLTEKVLEFKERQEKYDT